MAGVLLTDFYAGRGTICVKMLYLRMFIKFGILSRKYLASALETDFYVSRETFWKLFMKKMSLELFCGPGAKISGWGFPNGLLYLSTKIVGGSFLWINVKLIICFQLWEKNWAGSETFSNHKP